MTGTCAAGRSGMRGRRAFADRVAVLVHGAIDGEPVAVVPAAFAAVYRALGALASLLRGMPRRVDAPVDFCPEQAPHLGWGMREPHGHELLFGMLELANTARRGRTNSAVRGAFRCPGLRDSGEELPHVPRGRKAAVESEKRRHVEREVQNSVTLHEIALVEDERPSDPAAELPHELVERGMPLER